MEAALAGLLGVTVGGIITLFVQSYFSIRGQEVAHINDFISDLERIENLSVQYWLHSTSKNEEDQAKLAAQLRGAMHATGTFYTVGPKLLGGDWKTFREWDGKLFDAATGGDFESTSQTKEPERVVEIMQCTNELRALLRSARRKAFWAR